MTTHPKRLGGLAAVALIALAACSSTGGSTAPSSAAASSTPSTAPSSASGGSSSAAAIACVAGKITALGSTALQPLVDAAGKQYTAACSGSTIDVQGGGSGTGLTQVLGGGANIGNSDITADSKLKPDEAAQLVDHVVAKQGWVMVVNKDVTGVAGLTAAQATDIWTGKVTNWKDVGGKDEAIVLVLRPASSGTRTVFRTIVLGGATEAAVTALQEDSNGAVTAAVSTTPGATSVVGFAYYQQNKDKLTALQLDGVDASVANMANGTYKLQGVGHMYTKGQPDGLAKSFLDYMLGNDVQHTLIPSMFYAPAGQ